ncbi:dihydroneopterin aldolase [Bacillus taeanensis]|uniref:7,8-dihydroneopterin aldolase n=1 Tax=Bacillus taeanensis TaxID=273032 RepID=A0A366XNG4_9BACI|nr:dihydroneopterin aldolase [Bacillus taeanensis]RBW67662.1 dihydroneopterin aldolase [Bacillus taeanensis]
MDKIHLNEMAFYGYHGVLPEENKLGQRFFVDLILGLNLKNAGLTDDLKKTVNYAEAYETVRSIVEGKRRQLVEAVAEGIAKEIFDAFPIVEEVKVKVVKPDPPIRGHYRSVAVEITRKRS